jgi:hypothetical protein
VGAQGVWGARSRRQPSPQRTTPPLGSLASMFVNHGTHTHTVVSSSLSTNPHPHTPTHTHGGDVWWGVLLPRGA